MRISILALAAATAFPAAAAAGPVVRDGTHPVPQVSLRAPMAPHAGTSWENSGDVARPRATRARAFNRYRGYRMIGTGGVLPNYWSAPQYGIGNYGHYGFNTPLTGTRWVRYYDDALLVDQFGRVRDGRYGVDFDRYGDRWGRDARGVPVYVGDGEYARSGRDYAWEARLEREDGDLVYDRDYPYDRPYRGEGSRRAESDYGYSYDTDEGYGGYVNYDSRAAVAGYIVTETVTTTTSPSTVSYVQRPVTVHRRAYKAPRRYKAARRVAAASCRCK